MSIKSHLDDARERGDLCILGLQTPDAELKRTMYIHSDVMAALDQWPTITRMGELIGDLEAFIRGEHMTMCMTPRKHKNARMGLLSPESEGTWDIRSRHKSPGIRVLGRFVARDIFVALEWRPRSKPMEEFDKVPLSEGRSGDEWQYAMIEVHQRWQKCLPDLEPLTGGNFSDYVSENCSPV